jgi:hypothetical protein
MAKELVMYSRTYGCAYITLAKPVFDDYAVDYREIFIDRDSDARDRVLAWTGFLTAPVGNRFFIALAGTLNGFLAAPADLLQQTPHMA